MGHILKIYFDMKERLLKVYNCSFCNKRYLIKTVAYRHEEWCGSNPKNWPACNGCVHLEQIEKDITVYAGTYNEYSRTVKSFWCGAKKVGLYPSKCLQTDMVKKYPENFIDEELMPKECEFLSTMVTDDMLNSPNFLPW